MQDERAAYHFSSCGARAKQNYILLFNMVNKYIVLPTNFQSLYLFAATKHITASNQPRNNALKWWLAARKPNEHNMIANGCSHCSDSHPPQHNHQHQTLSGTFAAMSRRSIANTTTATSAPNKLSHLRAPFAWLYRGVRSTSWSDASHSVHRWSEVDHAGRQHSTTTPQHQIDQTPPQQMVTCMCCDDQCPDTGYSSSSCCGDHDDQNGGAAATQTTTSDITLLPSSDTADHHRTSSNPPNEPKRTRRATVRRSSHRSVWWAVLLTHSLLVLSVLAVTSWLNPIRGVAAGTEFLMDQHVLDKAGKVPQNQSANGDGSEYIHIYSRVFFQLM